MFKKLSFLFFKILLFIDVILKFILNRRLLPFFREFFHKNSYRKIKILDNEIKFFTPNQLTEYRVDTFFTKEPDMLRWIDNFKEIDKLIFWDIGANIGLYSIYNALKNKTSTTISFEPSTSNLRCLSRNISINNLENKISIFPLALSDKENIISHFKETKFSEGGSISNFNSNIDSSGEIVRENQIMNKYNLFGTSIDNLIMNNILKVPNYIKIDVDGIEHLILTGAKNLLKNKNLRELSIEMNPTYIKQYEFINNVMEENNFKKIISTNFRLLGDKNYKLKPNENVNEIFKRND
mgnify:CR=1 FL=1